MARVDLIWKSWPGIDKFQGIREFALRRAAIPTATLLILHEWTTSLLAEFVEPLQNAWGAA